MDWCFLRDTLHIKIFSTLKTKNLSGTKFGRNLIINNSIQYHLHLLRPNCLCFLQYCVTKKWAVWPPFSTLKCIVLWLKMLKLLQIYTPGILVVQSFSDRSGIWSLSISVEVKCLTKSLAKWTCLIKSQTTNLFTGSCNPFYFRFRTCFHVQYNYTTSRT